MINNIGGSGKGMRTVCLRVEKCRWIYVEENQYMVLICRETW